MNSKANIVSIANLGAGYSGKPVLHDVNLNLEKGEICCVIGEEGAGKSTLLKAIVQQLRNNGKISFNGTDLRQVLTVKMVKHGVDFIAQGGNILKGFTVEEHIRLALSGKSDDEKSRVWKEVEQTFPKIIALKRQIAGRLSGGERMILSLACLLATDAEFLILDEPTAGLAPETCVVIGDFLLRLKKERSKTILLMEHNYDFAFEVADTVVTLKDGKVSEKYLPEDFKKKSFVDEKLFQTINS